MSNSSTDYGQFIPDTYDFTKFSELVRFAFCHAISENEVPDSSFAALKPEILLVINGKKFSFESIIEQFNKYLDQEIDKVARRKMEDKVKLSDIAERLYSLSYRINEELDTLFPGSRNPDDY